MMTHDVNGPIFSGCCNTLVKVNKYPVMVLLELVVTPSQTLQRKLKSGFCCRVCLQVSSKIKTKAYTAGHPLTCLGKKVTNNV